MECAADYAGISVGSAIPERHDEFRAMCGGCRARVYGYFDDYFEADPGCKYNRNARDRLVAGHREAAG